MVGRENEIREKQGSREREREREGGGIERGGENEIETGKERER